MVGGDERLTEDGLAAAMGDVRKQIRGVVGNQGSRGNAGQSQKLLTLRSQAFSSGGSGDFGQ